MASTALMQEVGGQLDVTHLGRLIRQVMDDTGDNQSDIARRAGLSPQAISDYLSGKLLSRLEKDTISKLAAGLRVDPWLVVVAVARDMGHEPMTVDDTDPTLGQISAIAKSLPPQDRRRLLRLVISASEDD